MCGLASFATVAAAESRPTWPGYLAFALLVVGLLAVVWHNQRARRRASRRARETPEDSARETPD